jgi:signal transduction histidine kinase/ActR/RegA family two-component response regulator
MFPKIRGALHFPALPHLGLHCRRRCPTILAVGIAFCLTLSLFFVMRRWERRDMQSEFDYASQHFVEAVRRATERIELTHEVIRRDFYGSPTISREEFTLCAEPFLARVPSLKVLQWAPRVMRDDREAFVKTARGEGRSDYRIVEPDMGGRLVPAAQRNEYFPIWFAASKTGFQARFGWDFAADPVLRNAMDESRDDDRFVVSDTIDLRKIGVCGTMLQTFLPLYRDYQKVKTTAQRRENLMGFLVGLSSMEDLVNCALRYSKGPQGIDMAVYDDSASADSRLLYFHTSRTRCDHGCPEKSQAERQPGGIYHTEAIRFGCREWSLVCTPAPHFFSLHASWRSWTTLVIGLLGTVLLGGYTWSATTRTERIERLVEQRTAELRKKDEQLQQSQKLEAVGSLAGGIAHEFNNLLQAIGGYTRYAMEAMKPEEQPYQDLENVLQASDRAASLTRQLLSFSRRQTVERTCLDANQMVVDLTKMLRPLLGETIQMRCIPGSDIGSIYADAGSLQQVLMNLCLNARDAMPNGGEIVVKTNRVTILPDFADLYSDLKPGPYVEVNVTDTGHGMSPEVRDRIFEPFFTTKPVGKGTGLGLAMVYGIIQQHEGAIHVYSELDHGTTFRIYLPVYSSELEGGGVSTTDDVVGGSETILLAEDDPMVRDVSKRILERAGYHVLLAADGEMALTVFRAHHDTIALVLLDAVMPRLSGQDAYRQLKDEYPDVRVIFCSGYAPETAHSNFIVQEHLRLVEKPYNPTVLLSTIREVLDAEELCPTT